jgi:hypothetical protein
MLMWAVDEVFIGCNGGPTSTSRVCLTPEHLPWIDPTHPP